jgi:hypothetical protein
MGERGGGLLITGFSFHMGKNSGDGGESKYTQCHCTRHLKMAKVAHLIL